MELGIALDVARQIEPIGAADKGLRKERGYADEAACVGLLRQAQTQCRLTLRMPHLLTPTLTQQVAEFRQGFA